MARSPLYSGVSVRRLAGGAGDQGCFHCHGTEEPHWEGMGLYPHMFIQASGGIT